MRNILYIFIFLLILIHSNNCGIGIDSVYICKAETSTNDCLVGNWNLEKYKIEDFEKVYFKVSSIFQNEKTNKPLSLSKRFVLLRLEKIDEINFGSYTDSTNEIEIYVDDRYKNALQLTYKHELVHYFCDEFNLSKEYCGSKENQYHSGIIWDRFKLVESSLR